MEEVDDTVYSEEQSGHQTSESGECTSSLLHYLCNICSAHISVDIIARSQYRVISRSQAVAVVVILAMFAILRAKCENQRQTG